MHCHVARALSTGHWGPHIGLQSQAKPEQGEKKSQGSMGSTGRAHSLINLQQSYALDRVPVSRRPFVLPPSCSAELHGSPQCSGGLPVALRSPHEVPREV